MDKVYLKAFQKERTHLHDSWASLLRLEPISSALAHPDTLVHMINLTIEELYTGIDALGEGKLPPHEPDPTCACGMNPFLTYFSVGRQAIQEAFVIGETQIPLLQRGERDEAFEQLEYAYRTLAAREIRAFCGLCQYRKLPAFHRDSQNG